MSGSEESPSVKNEDANSETDVALENVLLKVLKSSEQILDDDLIQNVRKKIEEITENQQHISTAVQYFLYVLLAQVEQLQHAVTIDIQKQDYVILESSVQKSEAEIRKHIKIQQQLKIYMDGLEEKVEQLERQLQIQENKYFQLFESMKAIDNERKDLLKKVARMEERIIEGDQVTEKKMSQKSCKEMFHARDKPKQNKSKMIIERITQKHKKFTNPTSSKESKLKFLEGSIHVNIDGNGPNKKNSFNANHQKSMNVMSRYPDSSGEKVGYEPSLKQLTKTVQMNQLERKKMRRINKYRTETSQKEKKEDRSHSVIN